MSCARRCCPGRRWHTGDGDVPLLPISGAGSSHPREDLAAKGLRHADEIRRHLGQLAEVAHQLQTQDAQELAGSEAILAAMRLRLGEMEVALHRTSSQAAYETADEAARGNRAPQEAVSCIVNEGDSVNWRQARVLLSSSMMMLEGAGHADTRKVTWGEVLSVTTNLPDGSGSGGGFMTESELRLSMEPGVIRLKFSMGQPACTVEALWRAHHDTALASSFEVAPVPHILTDQWEGYKLYQNLLSCRGEPDFPLVRVLETRVELPGLSLKDVYDYMSLDDNPIQLMWATKEATMMGAPPWEQEATGLVRRVMIDLPLHPKPIMRKFGSPDRTRMCLVYHLTQETGEDQPRSVKVHYLSKALDIPVDCFFLKHMYKFTEAEDGVHFECSIGWVWTARSMLRSIIESVSKEEGAQGGRELCAAVEQFVKLRREDQIP